MTFDVAATPSFEKRTVTVSQSLTLSSGAMFLYSSVCQSCTKETVILTFGVPRSAAAAYAVALARSFSSVISSLSPKRSEKSIIKAL